MATKGTVSGVIANMVTSPLTVLWHRTRFVISRLAETD